MTRNIPLGVYAAAQLLRSASGGGGTPVGQIISVTGSTSTTSASTLTYTSAPLGTAVSGRILYIVCTYFDGSSTAESPSSVTVGGNSATLLQGIHAPSTTTCGISIWSYQDDGALGANANVVATHATARNSLSIAVVEASEGGGGVVDFAEDADTTASIASSSLTTAGSACLLYVCMSQNGTDPTAPSPFTDGQSTFDEASNEWVCVAWANTPSGSSETVDVPASGMGLRSAYLALALD